MLSGAEMVVRSLIDQGVKQVFGYPEAQCLIFMMRYIPLEGSIMCWCVMSRPRCIWRMAGASHWRRWRGAGDFRTGSDQCDYRDCYGLYGFHSAGDSFRPVATSLIGYDAFQECDMVGISRPVVKHSFWSNRRKIFPVLKKAFWLAASGRLGRWSWICRKIF